VRNLSARAEGAEAEVHDKSRDFWNREVQAPTYVEWMGIPLIRRRINRLVSGEEGGWPLDWFERAYPGKKFERALSIGCGTGALERDLARRGICGSILAFDASMASLAIARREARAAGVADRIHYYAADFNAPILPGRSFDAVFIHQALHHVAKLEKLLREVLKALRPGGIFYLEELVGPSRDAWSAERLRPLAEAYAALPRELRRFDALPAPIQDDDPSEAIRSGEIREQLAIGFDVEHDRGYGGNALAVLVPSLEPGAAGEAMVARLIAFEDELLARGEPHFYAVLATRPKAGFRGALASARYFLEPKIKRVGREVRSLLRG